MDDHLEIFDNYFNGNLSEEEKKNFNGRLETDSDFKFAYEEYQIIISGINQIGIDDLKLKLKKREEYHQNNRSSTPKLTFLFKIAAATILLVAFTFLILKYIPGPNYEVLYAENYELYPNIVDPLNRSDQPENISVYQLYEQRKYQEVVDQLTDQPMDEQRSQADFFYLGQSYLALEQPVKSLQVLLKINQESAFYQPAQWYIALSYLKEQKVNQLKRQLQGIIDHQSDYSLRAEELKKCL